MSSLHEVKGGIRKLQGNERDASWGKYGVAGGRAILKHTGLRPLEKESDGASLESGLGPTQGERKSAKLTGAALLSTCGLGGK